MDHLEDVTPHELFHAAVPQTTVDDLTKTNLLSLGVLTNFLRHAPEYGQTLSKLVKQSGSDGPKYAQISRAYNTLIDRAYVGRVEFGYERPAGAPAQQRSGQRATYLWVSRVPTSEERFAMIIHKHTPGNYTFTPIWSGAFDEKGRKVYEMRRVKVLSAEVYYWDGVRRIHSDGLLSERIEGRRRGSKAKATSKRAQPQGGKGTQTTTSPDSENSSSGASSTDAPTTPPSSHVTPELDFPESGESDSIKTGPWQTDHLKTDQELPPSLSLGCPPEGTPPTSECPPGKADHGYADTDETDQAGLAGERAPARARDQSEEPLVKDALEENPDLAQEQVERIIMQARPQLSEGTVIGRASRLIKIYRPTNGEALRSAHSND